jgi:hypothetical protein
MVTITNSIARVLFVRFSLTFCGYVFQGFARFCDPIVTHYDDKKRLPLGKAARPIRAVSSGTGAITDGFKDLLGLPLYRNRVSDNLVMPSFLICRKKSRPHDSFSLFPTPVKVAAKKRPDNQEENVMKNLFTVVILGIAFAGVSLAQPASEEKASERPPAARAAEVKVAVVEFSPGPNASGMTAEAKRHLQASLAFALFESRRFDVVDVRRTRDASQSDLAALNGGSLPAAAVKLGKQLGVSYVLTGTVVEYTPKGADGFGLVILKTWLIEVATGKIKHAGETTQRSTSAMRTNGAAEMQTKALKPAIEKLTATLAGLRL